MEWKNCFVQFDNVFSEKNMFCHMDSDNVQLKTINDIPVSLSFDEP